jgi:NADPH:quinone reductase-like Zn-dependent oxidoreductase
MVNACVEPGHKVLITGIGGGVALLALQFCVAAGASVYVTSGSSDKLQKAMELGAKGGVSYKDRQYFACLSGSAANPARYKQRIGQRKSRLSLTRKKRDPFWTRSLTLPAARS